MPASKFNRAIVGVAILISTITAYAFGAAPGDLVDYRWLANHPARSLLSSGGELGLQDNLRRWAALSTTSASARSAAVDTLSRSSAAATLDRPGSFVLSSGVNKLVNNPAGDINPRTTQSEPSIAIFGQRVVVGYNDSNNFSPSNYSGYAISGDGGSTFEDKGVIPAGANGNFGDPVLAVDNKGDFYYVTLFQDSAGAMRIGVARSLDGGETFSAPVLASRGPEIFPEDFLDKPWITVDQKTNTIYVVWGRLRSEAWAIHFSSSADGINFTDARTLHSVSPPLIVNGAQVAVGVNGEVFIAWTKVSTADSASIEFCEVPGSGACSLVTVSNFTRTGTPVICEKNRTRQVLNGNIRVFLDIPTIVVDQTDGINRGKIYLAWTQKVFLPFGQVDQAEVYFSRRDASGGPWLVPRQVKVNPKDQFFPAVAVSNDGTLAVMYYSREDDVNNRLIHVYMARSTDAGDTFSYQRITDMPTGFDVPTLNPNFDPNFFACYMGDYNQVIASDGENFYFVWGDNRDTIRYGRPDPDVFFTAVTAQPKTYFAQVVDGSGWKTKFLATNLDKASNSQFRLELFKSDGTPFNVLEGGTTNTVTRTLSPSGATEIETASSGAATAGWARFTTLDTPRAGFVTLNQFYAGSMLQKEAGYLPSLPFKTGVILVDQSFSSGADTSLAIANQSDAQSTTVTLTLRDPNGNQVGTPATVNLGIRQHTARFINELFPGQVPSEFQGTLLASSSVTNIAASLRQDASGAQNTNFPVFSGTFPTTSYFADVVNGGGWTTDFGSANLSDTLSGTVTIETFTQSGAPWSILPGGISQTFNLAPRGSGFVETIGGAAFQRGWARIRVTNSRHIGSFQVHQQRAGGPISSEAGDVSRVATKFSHTFGLNSPNTGYAVSNDSTTTATVTFELFSSTGASQGTSNLTLGPGQQQVKALTDLFPGAPAITAGSLRITSTSAPGTTAPVAVRALRLDGTLLATYPIF